MDKLNIVLNGKVVSGFKGESILQLAKRYGIEIPTLCNDERLEPYSSCFLCVVEVEGMRGLQPACSTKIVEGMKVTTDNEKIRSSRKSALELLVSNHYADCIAPCKLTCPAGVDVQGYIALIDKGKYKEVVGLIKQTNPFPAICGRVCVRPCELACRRNLLEDVGVGIDYLKRYATDKEFESGDIYIPSAKLNTGKNISIIGAGPGGLTAAYYLALEGHNIDVYEAQKHPGGMLRYGIPPYRLPNDVIDREVKCITDFGVKIYYEKKLGENLSYQDLKSKYDALILSIGSQSGSRIGCENDNAGNVLSGIDFLRNMEITGQHYDFTGKKVAVIGGGNTAMDCCRTAARCGAEKTYIIYRRTEKEMPANPIEIHESRLEGVEYMFLTAPGKVNVDEKGCLKSLTCFKMQLGEPDASGRRRPVKVDNSEFEIELDYILAAIGQKTNVNFIDNINNNSDEKLILNKWGDIEANKITLQTSIKSIFAAGDSVTGPATLIEAIAQGRKAAGSCHQFVMGLPVTGEKFEFISRKDNFKKQVSEDYVGRFREQEREEMPTLDPKERKNFNEVELGYDDKQAAGETERCLECGCAANFICDLKKYCTEYNVDQKKYSGEFKNHDVNFSHPFIEIDNNKCILCSRCVRICREIVGANALGLVNRGFETFVAPGMKNSLLKTDCESCGMCISACPTGAISENVIFKPGPYELDSFDTICNYCSVGCEITLHHKNGFYMKVTGKNGVVNTDGNICRFPKFGYNYLNDKKRILKPLLKTNGKFAEISFEKAYEIICEKIKSVMPDENVFFAGARLSNEELYLIQKFARAAVKTNNVSSFHYLGRENGYADICKSNVPFSQIKNANKIYLVGSEINYENAVVGYMINDAKLKNNTKIELVTDNENSRMIKKVDRVLFVKSYYYFIKALNHYILSNMLENRMFINDKVKGFDSYKKSLLEEDFNSILNKSGVFFEKRLVDFANDYNNTMNAIIVFSERHISSDAAKEIRNLALITGKLGKTSGGIICLKEKNNSQGLFDMGIMPSSSVGGRSILDPALITEMKKLWIIKKLPENVDNDLYSSIQNNKIKNLFIFGEDPLGCAVDKEKIRNLINRTNFRLVQDFFMTETAETADLILPASFQFESGGSYSNAQKFVVTYDMQREPLIEKRIFGQLTDLMSKFGVINKFDFSHDITMEIAALLKKLPDDVEGTSFNLEYTEKSNCNRMFNYGCDNLIKIFEEYFNSKLNL